MDAKKIYITFLEANRMHRACVWVDGTTKLHGQDILQCYNSWFSQPNHAS